MIRRIENWPTSIGLRIFRRRPGLRLLTFRDGLKVVCRGGTRDWDVIHELMFAGGYRRAFSYLRKERGVAHVVDLGGNLGLFSLIAASTNPRAQIMAFEPGPPNRRLFEMNLLANPRLSDRIVLHPEAVGSATGTVEWFFDENNPGGSSLFGVEGERFSVEMRTLAEVVSSMAKPISLLKIDVEGAEYEILSSTPAEVWLGIQAIALELHHDPAGLVSQQDYLTRMESFGFHVEQESVCSYFLSR